MMAIVQGLVFVSAFTVAVMVIFASVAPQWRRIASLVVGQVEPPVHVLSLAERRIAVRRLASASTAARLRRMSEAA